MNLLIKICKGYYIISFKPTDEDEEKSSRKAEHAAEAIKFFETLRGVPGVWDIFITKLVEVSTGTDLPSRI